MAVRIQILFAKPGNLWKFNSMSQFRRPRARSPVFAAGVWTTLGYAILSE
jgi:hypothetical protein